MLHIKNTTIQTPDRVIERGSVLVDGQRIAAVGTATEIPAVPGAHEIDATGLTLVPGFIELQLNGAFGHDFTDDPSTIWKVGEQITRYGVTAFLPTIITSPLEKVDAGRAIVTGGAPAGYRGAIPLGLHAEGPFLNPKRKGAHNANYLRPPTLEAVAGWFPEAGVRLVTMAPELPGALEVIDALAARGIVVSVGHSDATYEQAVAGFDAGALYGTHLFNAQSSLGHREPGVPGALLADDRITVGFIADGVHTHRSIIKIVYRVLGPRRMSLVTDAMAALGMGPGVHRLGDYEVIVDATSARLTNNVLGGSILSLDQALRNVTEITGCMLADGLAMMTTTPARLLGLDKERGQVAPGFLANLVLLSPDLHVRTTIVSGDVVFEA